jgi:predicted transcriptional regulator
VRPAEEKRAAATGTALAGMADLLTPMALRVAATLQIADHLAQGRRTATGLAAATNVNADALDRLLRHLVTVGVLQRGDEGEYALTALGGPLRSDHASRLRAIWDIDGALGRAELAFVDLLHSVRTGEAAFPVRYGRSFWDDLATDPARVADYNSAMGSDVTAWAPAIVSAYDWGALDRVVDVGGGNGSLLAALLDAYPTLHGTVFEQPVTAAAARDRFAALGLGARADAVSGSFFETLPAGAGGYLLTAIIHDWDDRHAELILRACAEAAGTRGRVFVIEKVGVDGSTPNTWMDLLLLVHMAGKERTREELTDLAARADLRVVAFHAAGPIVILELAALDGITNLS